MTRIIVAEHAGACFGVERALDLASRAAADATTPVHTLGPLIHNPQVVASLSEQGVTPVERLEDAEEESVLIMRAHGVTPEVERRAQARGLKAIDATCPFVKKVHRYAERLESEGYQVVIVGEAGHPETEGTRGHAPNAVVVGSAGEARSVELARRVGVVVQTTLERSVLREVVGALIGRCEELRLVDTICGATSERQGAAADLAAEADVMVVIGGRSSANTRHLVDVCAARCSETYHVELPDELEGAWFDSAELVGVTAGASTPADQIEAVTERIRELCGERTDCPA
ncbi:MAG: 4-hydroxy-3-methylbut-2-enyl diphosphate reductase [Atopobiaceae bacterium]|nr:4-hydroxy-3-methylbut-2-enyl diphosphate reductase [Atopobiaceae bacterium]